MGGFNKKGRLGITSANLWRKQMVIEAGMWDNIKSSQESSLMFKMLKLKAKVKYDDHFETLVKNLNPHSISNADRKNNWIRYIELRAGIWNYPSEINGLSEKNSDRSETKICLTALGYCILMIPVQQ